MCVCVCLCVCVCVTRTLQIWIVGSYFHYSVPGGFTDPKCADITPRMGFRTDPMYVVSAAKKA